MTNPDFDEEFDIKDISNILKDIDGANLALDSLEGRADKLAASLQSLLKAQSQVNPYQNVEPAPLEKNESTPSSSAPSDVNNDTK
ncbi:hypothetical protein BGZ94_010226 [Podila epigama]|nr:hypothetical protein BGZ94_010226 [Podila epigama]